MCVCGQRQVCGGQVQAAKVWQRVGAKTEEEGEGGRAGAGVCVKGKKRAKQGRQACSAQKCKKAQVEVRVQWCRKAEREGGRRGGRGVCQPKQWVLSSS